MKKCSRIFYTQKATSKYLSKISYHNLRDLKYITNSQHFRKLIHSFGKKINCNPWAWVGLINDPNGAKDIYKNKNKRRQNQAQNVHSTQCWWKKTVWDINYSISQNVMSTTYGIQQLNALVFIKPVFKTLSLSWWSIRNNLSTSHKVG